MPGKPSGLTAVLESLARLESKLDSVGETMATMANDHRELRDKHDAVSAKVTSLEVRMDQADQTIKGWKGFVGKVAAGIGIALFLATLAMVFKK